ncbi:hypothetical protein BH24ACT5_BH24ACT5_30620 [soil metagenome]
MTGNNIAANAGALVVEREPWTTDAACRGLDPDLFFPQRGAPPDQAKAVCAGCPVRAECLDYALTHHELFGVWGGTTGKQRRRLRNGRRANAVACGTRSGYQTHQNRHEAICDACREASNVYMRERRQRA